MKDFALSEQYYDRKKDRYDIEAFAADEQLDSTDGDMFNAEYAATITAVIEFMDGYNRAAGHAADARTRRWLDALNNVEALAWLIAVAGIFATIL